MLAPRKVEQELERNRPMLLAAAERSRTATRQYREALQGLVDMTPSQVIAGVGGVEWPGALPTAEWERGFVLPFAPRWEEHGAAAAWARETLRGVTTVAVDGSQIAPSKEFGVPLSLVQVAWFENPHDPARMYVKDVRTELVMPGSTAFALEEMEEYAFAESRLNQRRFVLEMEAATARIARLQPQPPPLVLLDGALVLSFTGRLAPPARTVYLDALFQVLDASEPYRVPVVGYIDTSFASDLATLVRTVADLRTAPPPDGLVLQPWLGVFERTAACRCARADVLRHYRRGQVDRSRDIYFTYLQIGPTRPPARLEFPGWVLTAGLLDQVVDLVRAEIVVGTGYPYALETADATAVLSQEDRLAFYRLFHDFAAANGLDRDLPGKMVSKGHRR